MAYEKHLEFGNFTLTFGDKKVLLDCFDDVVWPSFQEMKYTRNLKDKGEYFFIDTSLVKLVDDANEPVVGITGRIVKNTKLKRDQIYRREKGVVVDESELETAPSSLFLLILNSHRLIFCREVPGAPTLQNFQSTCASFLKQRHKEFIGELFEDAKNKRLENPENERVTKVSLMSKHPYPILRITALSDSQSLKQFVDGFKHIDHVTIKLLPTNEEGIDNDDFWSDLGRRGKNVGSKAVKVEFNNKADGLNKDAVYEQAKAASDMGNSEVRFRGNDKQDDYINGTNDDFDLSVEIEELSRNTVKSAQTKFSQFMYMQYFGQY